MKTIFIFLTSALLTGQNALACAGCMDIVPVTISMEASQKTLDSFKGLKYLASFDCKKEQNFWDTTASYSCSIETADDKSSKTISFGGVYAEKFFKQLNSLKVEPTTYDEASDTDRPSGKYYSVGERHITGSFYQIKLSSIHWGRITVNNNKVEFDIAVLNWASPLLQL